VVAVTAVMGNGSRGKGWLVDLRSPLGGLGADNG